MTTFLMNINWTDVLAIVGGLAVGALMVVLMAYVQLRNPGTRNNVPDWRTRMG